MATNPSISFYEKDGVTPISEDNILTFGSVMTGSSRTKAKAIYFPFRIYNNYSGTADIADTEAFSLQLFNSTTDFTQSDIWTATTGFMKFGSADIYDSAIYLYNGTVSIGSSGSMTERGKIKSGEYADVYLWLDVPAGISTTGVQDVAFKVSYLYK